ncbi:MAG: filamentous hemagglutinin N-terminal domain-containing protein [Agarilytica sp.]
MMKQDLPPHTSLFKAIRQIITRTAVASMGLTAASALAGPDGGRVVDGDASIEQSGNTTTIHQNTRRTIIDWRDFSIDHHERVDFIQPDSSSVALNRVTGDGRSYIDGALSANGKVFILNGNGIIFGKNARIDVGGLLASTFDIRNEDFMRGEFNFSIPGKADAGIYNYGSISVAEAGLAAFVAPYVENNGLIYARYGRVALGASEYGFALDLYGDELIRLAVSDEFSERLGLLDEVFGVSNDGTIQADGGSILLSAERASEVLSEIITVGGELRADSIAMQDGAIVLNAQGGEVDVQESATVQSAGGSIQIASASAILDGTVDVSADNAGQISVDSDWISVGGALEANGEQGGSITLSANDIVTAGEINALGNFGDGGNVQLHAEDEIIQVSTTTIDASGAINGGNIRMTAGEQITSSASIKASGVSGKGGSIDVSAPTVKSLSAQFIARGGEQGGRVRLGGEYQGGKSLVEDELPNAETLILSSGSLVDVSGGSLSSSAESGAADQGGEVVLWSDQYTVFQGRIEGEGARVEVSSSGSMHYDGEINIGAGELLLDPKNIIIDDGTTPTTLNLILGFGHDYDETSLEADDGFGSAVALDGTHLAVGAPGDDGASDSSADAGAVYLYTFANTELESPSLSAVIGDGYTSISGPGFGGVAQQDPEAGDQFGSSVALDGNLLVVGAPGDDGEPGSFTAEPDSGAVYLFSFSGDFTGLFQETIIGDEYGAPSVEDFSDVILVGDDSLGSAVAVDSANGRLAIAQEGDDGDLGNYNNAGSIYLFSFDAGTSFDNLARESAIGDYQSLTGTTAFDFEYFAVGPDISGGFPDPVRYTDDDDFFGSSIALHGDLLAVGARGDDGQGDSVSLGGAVYLYSFVDGAHDFDDITLEAVIGADYSTRAEDVDNTNLIAGDEFGTALALEGTNLYVGAPQDQSGRGAVYGYSFTGDFTSITDEGRYGNGFVGANDVDVTLASGDNFGQALSLDGAILAIGASGDDGFGDPGTVNASGAAYIFHTDRVDHNFAWGFADSPGNTSIIDVNDLTTLLDAGTAVILQASNDITVETAIAVNNAGGDGGTIVFQAGRSIIVEDDITTDNADITLVANDTAVNGVVDADRDAGAASITFTSGSTLDAGSGAVTLTLADGAGNTNNTVGDISLDAITAGSLTIANANTGSSVTDNAALIIAGTTDINASGADVTFDFATNDFDSDDSGDEFTVDAATAEIFDVDQLSIGTSNVDTIVAEAGGNLTLSGTVTASSDLGDGNNTAIVLAAGANFLEIGSGDLNPGAGRFIVYSADPSTDTLVDLSATPWYNTAYNSGDPTAVSGTGDRFAYTQTATLLVTADDLSRDYGDANPTFTQTVTGYVNSETSAILSGSAGNASSAAIATTAVGTSTITATSGTLATDRNYSITTANGTLTIDPRPINVTADTRTRDYGDGTLVLGTSAFTVDDMANSETIGSVTLTSLSGNATDAAAAAGTYVGDIEPSAATGGTFTASNYAITYTNNDLVIDPVALSVTANLQSRTYGNTLALGSTEFTPVGLVNGDTIDSVTLSSETGVATNTNAAVGAYAGEIDISGATGAGFDAGNYTITYVDGTLNIDPRAITVIANDRNRIYGDTLTLGTGEFQQPVNMANSETIGSVILSSTGNLHSSTTTAVGTYVGNIVPSAATGGTFTASNYTITYQAADLTINERPIVITADLRTRDYGDGTMVLGTSAFSVDDMANSETIGAVTLASLSGNATDAGATAGTYSGDIDVSGATGGTFTASNYDITYVNNDLVIDPVALTITADPETKTYDGSAFTGGTLDYVGFVNGDTSTDLGGVLSFASGTSEGAVNVGSYSIQPRGQTSSNYTISYIDSTLTVNERPINVVANNRSRTFGDIITLGTTEFQQPANMVSGETIGAVTLTSLSGNDTDTAAPEGTYVGDIEPSLATGGTFNPANYAITYVNADLTIGLATLTITAFSDTKDYDGLAYSGGNGVDYSGFVNGDDSSALGGFLSFTSGTSEGAVDAGTYTLEPRGLTSGNYSIVFVDSTLTIDPVALTVSATPEIRTYDGSAFSNGNVTYSGFVNSETNAVLGGALSFATGSSEGAVDAGAYTIEPRGLTSGNYTISYVDSTLTINPAALSVTALSEVRTYDGNAYTGGNGVVFDGFVNSETEAVLGGSLSFASGTSEGATDAGTYVLEPRGLSSGNYAVTFVDATLTIDPASLVVTANPETRMYDGLAYSGGNGVIYDGFVNSETEAVLGGSLSFDSGTSEGAIDVGAYTLEARGLTSSNYSISFVDAALDITPAPLTITASSDSKTYDGIAYVGGNDVSYSGFVGSDDEVALSGALTYSGSSQSASDAGTYVLTPDGLTSTNYNITFVDSTLTISPAALVITADNQVKTYGDVLDLGSSGFASTGLAAGDVIGSVTLQSAAGIAADGTASVGTYAGEVEVSAASGAAFNANNYSINYQSGALEIIPAVLTVNADTQRRIYGDSLDLSSGTFTPTGLVNGEVIESVSFISGSGIAADTTADVGTYSGEVVINGASGTGFDANNYTITYLAADFTVDPRLISFAATDASKYTGDDDPDLSVNITAGSLANDDTLFDVTGEIGRESGEVLGNYDILLGIGVNAGNYDISFNENNDAFLIQEGVVVDPEVSDPDEGITIDDDEALPEIEFDDVNIPPVVVERDDPNSGTVVITIDEDSQVVGAIVLPEGNGEVVIETENKQPVQARPRALPASRFTRRGKKKKTKGDAPVVVTASVIIEKDGGLAIDLSDGRRISGITTPAAKFSEKGSMLVLERDRGMSSSPVGLATTISVVALPREGDSQFLQHMLLFDEQDQMMVVNFGGAGRPPLDPGRSKARVKFGLTDQQGNAINFIAIVTENGVVVRPQGEVATWLSQGSDDVIPTLALLALQTQLDINLDDIVAVYLVR